MRAVCTARQTYRGGFRTAAIGLALHFFIALTATAVYYLASRKLKLMVSRPIPSGALYGIARHNAVSVGGMLRLSEDAPGVFKSPFCEQNSGKPGFSARFRMRRAAPHVRKK